MVLEEQPDLTMMQEKLMSLVVGAMAEGEEFSASFEEHSHLWKETPEEFLQSFLTSGSAPEEGETEPLPEKPLAPGIPPLMLFQQKVWNGCLEMCQVLGCPREHWVPGEVPATDCDLFLSPD